MILRTLLKKPREISHMSNTPVESLKDRKTKIREQAHANRNAQSDKDELSKTILRSFSIAYGPNR